jgi:hypothetical protein
MKTICYDYYPGAVKMRPGCGALALILTTAAPIMGIREEGYSLHEASTNMSSEFLN